MQRKLSNIPGNPGISIYRQHIVKHSMLSSGNSPSSVIIGIWAPKRTARPSPTTPTAGDFWETAVDTASSWLTWGKKPTTSSAHLPRQKVIYSAIVMARFVYLSRPSFGVTKTNFRIWRKSSLLIESTSWRRCSILKCYIWPIPIRQCETRTISSSVVNSKH